MKTTVLILIIGMFLACNKQPIEPEHSIIGTWVHSEGSIIETYTFEETTGSYLRECDTMPYYLIPKFTWHLYGDTLIMSDRIAFIDTCFVSFKENKLVIDGKIFE